jgi:hypothetical protein
MVIGSAYNSANAPAYNLPQDKYLSGIKSRSIGSNSGGNELTFNDQAGSEEILFVAQKDFNQVVKNDAKHITSGNNHTTIKTGDHTIEVPQGASSTTAAKQVKFTVQSSSLNISPSSITISAPKVDINPGSAGSAAAGASTSSHWMRDTLDVLGIIACGAVDVVAIAGDEAGVGEVAQVEATEEAGALAEDLVGESAEDLGGGSEIPAKLPKNPDDLVSKHGYEENTHPDAAANGHREFLNNKTGDKLRFDKAKPGRNGHAGQDHYHRYNPLSKNKRDLYLDKDGNPVRENSNASHLYP